MAIFFDESIFGVSASPYASSPPSFPMILFLSTTLLTGMTVISLHMHWPLTSQSHGSGRKYFQIVTSFIGDTFAQNEYLDALGWLPLVIVILILMSHALGCMPITHMLLAEVFPTDIRYRRSHMYHI
jgi:hypothetical protein